MDTVALENSNKINRRNEKKRKEKKKSAKQTSTLADQKAQRCIRPVKHDKVNTTVIIVEH